MIEATIALRRDALQLQQTRYQAGLINEVDVTRARTELANVEAERHAIIRGRARIGIGEEVHDVRAGDVVFIPAGTPHWYAAEGEEPFEFLCAVPNAPDRIDLVDPPADAGRPKGVS